MLYFTENKSKCTGCTACIAACPVGCITIKKDEEGFLYPVASDKCIKCGKCERVCPIKKNKEKKEIKQEAYCAVTKDKKIWQRSASGGAFSEICRAFGDEKTIVCGAAWNGFEVEHICIEGVENIAPLCKSKYIESSINNCFAEIKSQLEGDKKVIFCGTPCQVAGLKGFLGRDYDSLLLIDLICHGVGSPKVFAACIENISKWLGKKIVSYEFRAKIVQKQNKEEVYVNNDPYIQLFLSQKALRPSCGDNCKFRNENRQGDITIADFKNLLEVFPKLNGTKVNYSTIVANSSKGKKTVALLNKTMDVYPCDIEMIKKYNPLFYGHTHGTEKRDLFFDEFIKDSSSTIEKWCKPATVKKDSIKRKAWRFLPVKVRRLALLLLGKFGHNVKMESEFSSCVNSRLLVKNDDKN